MPYEIGRSLPVTMAITPGSASALDTSMFLIRAWGSWLRRILHDSMRGSTMSSANFVWPVHFARASTFRKGLPTTFKGFPLLFPFLAIKFHSRSSESNLQVVLFIKLSNQAKAYTLNYRPLPNDKYSVPPRPHSKP